MSRAAQGSDVLIGIAMDKVVSDAGAAGDPWPIVQEVAAPAAPTTAVGIAGNITESALVHYIRHITYPWTPTTLGTGSTPLACTADAVDISVIPTSTSGEVIAREIWRSDSVHTVPYLLHTIYDNTTTVYVDDIAIDSATLNFNVVASALNLTGKNGGFVYLAEPEAPNFEADYNYIASKGLTGGAGQPDDAPGDVKIPITLKHPFETGLAIPVFSATLGKGTTTTRNADGTTQVDWSPSLSKFDGTSLTIQRSKGRPLRPELFLGCVFSEIEGTVNGGDLVDMTAKGFALNHTLIGLPERVTAQDADYLAAPMLKGHRTDSLFETPGVDGDLWAKVTTAATGGVMLVKFKTGAGAYGSTPVSVPYDTSTGLQIQSGSMTSRWAEAVDSNTGYNYGGDAGENRLPLMFLYPGDLRTIPPDYEFKFKSQASALIPGPGSTPGTPDTWYTGFTARQLTGPRMTSVHSTCAYGVGALSTPSTYLPTQDFKFKIISGLQPNAPDGKEARTPIDMDRSGYLGFQVDIERRAVDEMWKNKMIQDLRISLRVLLEGERIVIQPGTRSTNRRTIRIECVNARVEKSTTPIAGPMPLLNPVSFVARQYPGYEVFTPRIIDGIARWPVRT